MHNFQYQELSSYILQSVMNRELCIYVTLKMPYQGILSKISQEHNFWPAILIGGKGFNLTSVFMIPPFLKEITCQFMLSPTKKLTLTLTLAILMSTREILMLT